MTISHCLHCLLIYIILCYDIACKRKNELRISNHGTGSSHTATTYKATYHTVGIPSWTPRSRYRTCTRIAPFLHRTESCAASNGRNQYLGSQLPMSLGFTSSPHIGCHEPPLAPPYDTVLSRPPPRMHHHPFPPIMEGREIFSNQTTSG
ncbi:unnamed protein product [Tuber aestivum]|uniref:Secreted protein n=1 Tax=Tuber aestivum TaxID=59557 RepID=A0A292PWK3_9PEZI|nr:unnamed protein product [Tuber aestivum]